MKNNPVVSVVVPAYNTGETLPQCLDSIVCQTYRNLEIIIVNDGSTDNSLEIALSYKNTDARILVLDKQNGGLSSARNQGIRAASGRYVLHVDSDDWIERDMCEVLVQAAEAQDADIVCSDMFFETEKEHVVRREPYADLESGPSFLQKYVLRKGLNSVCNKLIRLSLYKANGIMHYEDISLGEDASALLRLVIVSQKICHVPSPLYHYNLKSAGMTRGIKKNIMEYYRGVCKVESFYQARNCGTDIFPLIRFKVAYSELAQCGLKKAWQLGYLDYKELAGIFFADMPLIVGHPHYARLSLKYRLFLHAYRLYYRVCPPKYK